MVCSALFAKKSASFYQVDLIIFTHSGTYAHQEADTNTLSPSYATTYALSSNVSASQTAYHLLPMSASQLREEYWALKRKREYQVLLHYSWLQPLNNQRALELPAISRDGWQVSGVLRIRRSNYYLLDSKLSFSSLNNQTAFVIKQKQRLKGNTIYYLDHPQAGMLIKLHTLT